jgi:prevent-host-death family protein
MRQVGVYEAKTQLPKLLECVEHGEEIEITRHGKPVAHLVPIARARVSRMTPREAIEEMKKMPKATLPEGMTVKDLIIEGRRY